MRPVTTGTAVTALALVLTLAACTSSASTTSGPAATTPATTAATAPAAGAGGAVNVCDLVPPSVAGPLAHQSYTTASPHADDAKHEYECEYGPGTELILAVVTSGATGGYGPQRNIAVQQDGASGVKDLSGFGDKAFYSPSLGLNAEIGDKAISVNFQGSGGEDIDKALAPVLISKL